MEQLVVPFKAPFQPAFRHFSVDVGKYKRLLRYLSPVVGEDAEKLLEQVDSRWHMAEYDRNLVPKGIEIPLRTSGWRKETCCHSLVEAWDSRNPVVLRGWGVVPGEVSEVSCEIRQSPRRAVRYGGVINWV